jgi:hypothetical protein
MHRSRFIEYPPNQRLVELSFLCFHLYPISTSALQSGAFERAPTVSPLGLANDAGGASRLMWGWS